MPNDVEVNDSAEALWEEEIRRRLQQIDAGAATLIPWEEVQCRLGARLQQ